MRDTGERAALGDPQGRPHEPPPPEGRAGAAERPGDDEHVARTRAAAARHALRPAERGDREKDAVGARRVAADDRHARLRQALVELDHLLDGGVLPEPRGHQERLGLRAGGRQVADVDRGGPEAELAPADPVQVEVDALDESVLGHHGSSHDRGVVLDPVRQAQPLELREEPELADLREPHRRPAAALRPRRPRG